MSEKIKSVVLLSGGLDSTTCMAIAHAAGEEIYPISFNYHQRHDIELESSKRVAAHYHVKRHLIIETNMEEIGGSALTDLTMDVPEGDVERTDVPATYVPARNLIFLSYALGYAEKLGASKVYIGVNSVDYSGYPDCRPEFIEKFQSIADYATAMTAVHGRKIEIVAPLQHMSKAQIIQTASKLSAPLRYTHSCYRGSSIACGICDSCKLRLQGFAEAGIEDPVSYAEM